ncbi:sigma-70 family RNA polymerase sigma factor [Candidatus Carsonella ruddii]|uniref:DNA-directed RNA polymerase beta subunit n=1 Tax=Carsonella ruddii TaxID=114186 RepID=A0A1U9RRE7_CARRU|nr:sigma-70 family RNA polymerase sigma factor [Candidatus Carsonella ruddii]AQU89488.1 DNA-directed RNA polymerase beta subunit [Candidatus Carsonella ruddii]
MKKYFLFKKKLFPFFKKINKKFYYIFKKNINKVYNIKKKNFIFLKKINKKNLFKKKILIINLINSFLIKFSLIKKFILKIFFYFDFFFSKKIFLYKKKFNLYKKKIKIKNFLRHIEKKIFNINKNLIIIKNKKNNIKQLINFKYLKTIIYLSFIKKKIDKCIIKNNIKILIKILKKYKKKQIYNDLYQECYIEFKNVVYNNNYCKNNFYKFCYWNIKKKMISIINFKKIILKNQLLSIDKPLFYHSLKYFISEKERSFLIEYTRNSLKNLIRELIASLPQREQQIIRLRFGIGYQKYYTLEEIGILHYLTKERIRQIELAIILKIRKPIIIELLTPYVKLLKALE